MYPTSEMPVHYSTLTTQQRQQLAKDLRAQFSEMVANKPIKVWRALLKTADPQIIFPDEFTFRFAEQSIEELTSLIEERFSIIS